MPTCTAQFPAPPTGAAVLAAGAADAGAGLGCVGVGVATAGLTGEGFGVVWLGGGEDGKDEGGGGEDGPASGDNGCTTTVALSLALESGGGRTMVAVWPGVSIPAGAGAADGEMTGGEVTGGEVTGGDGAGGGDADDTNGLVPPPRAPGAAADVEAPPLGTIKLGGSADPFGALPPENMIEPRPMAAAATTATPTAMVEGLPPIMRPVF